MITQANSYRIPLQDNSIHSVITSFPYYGLRLYEGVGPTIWGGDSGCYHVWESTVKHRSSGGPQVPDNKWSNTSVDKAQQDSVSYFCQLCGAWLGCFGLEPSISLHVQNAVAVCREIKRVLRPDGVFFLNYGDSYATSKNGRSAAATKAAGKDDRTFRDKPFSIDELPAKNLCLIPFRVAIALQDDGWVVRSDIIWSKPNPMPESVTDRPTKSHEYIFMLVKSARYFYDAEAIREPVRESTIKRYETGWNGNEERGYINGPQNHLSKFMANPEAKQQAIENGRNRRTVWEIATQSYSGAHFATFPTKLVEPMILASTSARGCCPHCKAQWLRMKEPTPEYAENLGKDWADYEADAIEGRGHAVSGQRPTKRNGASITASYKTTGWKPGCTCENNTPIPAVILDPFCGSGTVGEVARNLGRRFIGLDLSAAYLVKNALVRSERKTPQSAIDELPLFSFSTVI